MDKRMFMQKLDDCTIMIFDSSDDCNYNGTQNKE